VKIGLITDSVGHLPFESVLDLAKEKGLSSVEVATGNWSRSTTRSSGTPSAWPAISGYRRWS
jgi:hypothetical protein